MVNPCAEKWESFAKTNDGRGFCDKCSKHVIDFTAMSDVEVREFFTKSPSNVCGRIREEQLRVYSNSSPSRSISGFFKWPFAATTLLFSGWTALAQESDKIEQVAFVYSDVSINKYSGKVVGKVVDEQGVGLPGVNVVIKGTTTGTTTDLEGRYLIEISGKSTVLVYSSVGWATQEIEVTEQGTGPGSS